MFLNDLINRFGNETNKRRPNQSALLKFLGTMGDEELYSSIALAHNDMSRRATGHTDEVKKESVQWLGDRFKTNSPFGIGNQDDFNKWHDDTCKDYCDYMNKQKLPKTFKMTYGKAQKVLNMAFKYLYCTTKYKPEVEKIAEFLHMTLDGYTLRWYKDVIVEPDKALNKGDVSDWSKMNEKGKHQYMDIQKRIREYLKPASDYKYTINTEIITGNENEEEEEEKTNTKYKKMNIPVSIPIGSVFPFWAEFVIWEGEIVRAKIENLFKGVNGLYKDWTKDKWAVNANIEKELKDKLSELLKNI